MVSPERSTRRPSGLCYRPWKAGRHQRVRELRRVGGRWRASASWGRWVDLVCRRPAMPSQARAATGRQACSSGHRRTERSRAGEAIDRSTEETMDGLDDAPRAGRPPFAVWLETGDQRDGRRAGTVGDGGGQGRIRRALRHGAVPGRQNGNSGAGGARAERTLRQRGGRPPDHPWRRPFKPEATRVGAPTSHPPRRVRIRVLPDVLFGPLQGRFSSPCPKGTSLNCFDAVLPGVAGPRRLR